MKRKKNVLFVLLNKRYVFSYWFRIKFGLGESEL